MGKKARRTRFIPARTTYRVSLDKFLSQKQLWRKSIAKDGSCLFRAVAEQVYLSQNYHQRARLLCAEYIRTHQEDFKEFLTVPIEEYLVMLRDGKLWGGEVELVALSKLYGRPLVVYNEQDDSVQEQVFPSVEEDEHPTSTEELSNPILLAYCDGNHYDSVYTKDQKSSMASCQGLLYSILYERVMKDSIPPHCKQRLKSLTENDVIGTPPSDDRSLQLLRKHYPTEGIVGMAPQLYRNVAMDVYRRERDSIEQRDRRVAASIQFQVGDKCQVRIGEGQTYRGEVSRLDVTPGCHTVYVYESREEWEVPYKDITLPPSASNVPASARRNTAPSQNRLPKTQARPLVPGRTPSHQTPHNPTPATPRDTQPTRPPSGTSRDTQPPPTPMDSQLTHPPPAASKDSQPSLVTPRDPQPSNSTSTASREAHSTRLPTKSREAQPLYLHPGASRETQQTKKTTAQRRETAEGIENGGSMNQKLRREKRTKEVKKSQVKPTISTPTLDNVSFPPLPKKAPLLATVEVAIGKETIPLQATSVDSPLPGGVVNTSLHKNGATRLQKTTVSMVGGPGTVVPGQVSAPPMKVPLTPPFPNPGVNLTKTPPGPHGSLTSDDSSYSSSGEDSPNGNHPVNATSMTTNQSLVFQYSPFPLPSQLVTGAWEKDSKQPTQTESKKPMREWGGQQQRGGISTLQTKEPRTRIKGPKSKSDAKWKNNPPKFFDAGVDEQVVGGRESPYLEPQIPRTKDSSQPEDAWPMIILENPSPPTLPAPNDTANLPLPVMLHSVLPPSSPPLLMTSIPAPIPIVSTSLNETHMPATISPTASMSPSPQMRTRQPEPVKVPPMSPSPQVTVRQPEPVKVPPTSPSPQVTVRPPEPVKVSRNDHFTQTPTPVHCDKVVQICPEVLSQPTQTESRGVSTKYTQTKFKALYAAIVPADDLKPPPLTEESNMAHLKFIINYAAQCLKAYSRYSGDHVKETLMMVEQFEEMGLPNLVEDVKTASSSSSKEDGTIKLLDSEQQTFIQSLTKPPLLPAHDKKDRKHPKSLKKQTVVASSTSEPEQVVNPMKPGREAPNPPAKRSSSKQPTRGQQSKQTKQTKQPPSQNSQEPHSPSHVMPSATATTLKQEPPEVEPNDEIVEKPPLVETTKKLLVASSHENPPEDQEVKGEKGSVHPMEMMAQQEHSMHHYPMPHPQMVMAGARPPGIMMGMPMHPMWPYPPHMSIPMVPVYMPPNPFAPQMMPTAAPHMMPNQSLLPEQQQENPEKSNVQEQTTEDTSADSKPPNASESDQVIDPQVEQQAETTPQLLDQDNSEQGAEEEELGTYDQEATPSETELEQVDDYQECATDNMDDVQDNVRTESLPPPEDLSSTLEEPHHGLGSDSCSEVEHDSQISTPTSRPETPEDANALPTLPSLPCRGPSAHTHTQESGVSKKGPRHESEKSRKASKESRVSKTSQPPAAPAGKEESKEATDLKSEPQKHSNKHQYTSNRRAKSRVAGSRGGAASGSGSGKQSGGAGGGKQLKPTSQDTRLQDTGPTSGRSFNRERKTNKTSKYGSSGAGGRNTQEPTRGGAPYFTYSWADRSTHSILPSATHLPSFKSTFSLPPTDIDCHDTYSHAQDCSGADASSWPWPLGDYDSSQPHFPHYTTHYTTLPSHRRDTEFCPKFRTYTQHTNTGLRRQLNSENGTPYRWETEAHNS